MLKEHSHRALTVITASWLVGGLAARVQMLGVKTGYPFLTAACYFLPEIIVAAIFMVFLPSVWDRMRWTSSALFALAMLLLILLVTMTFSGLWFVSFVLLVFLAYVLRSDAAPAHPATWLFLALSKPPLYLGTPGAYLQLCAGAIGAIEGFRRGHWLLASVLLICSGLALCGLWTMWSISARAWAHGRYVVRSERERTKDARGLLAAWIAVIGLAAISRSIFRGEDVLVLSVLLVPSLLTATVIASMYPLEKIEGPVALSLRGLMRRTSSRQCVGVACGIAGGVLGILPVARPGYGICPLIDMFPISGDTWPTQGGLTIVGLHAGCSSGLFGQTVLLAMASVVFWISGLLTVAIGKSRDPWHGAIAAVVAALIGLTSTVAARVIQVLALPLDPLPPVSYYINWMATISIGIALVLWAARLGYLGGRRAVRYAESRALPAEETAAV